MRGPRAERNRAGQDPDRPIAFVFLIRAVSTRRRNGQGGLAESILGLDRKFFQGTSCGKGGRVGLEERGMAIRRPLRGCGPSWKLGGVVG